MRPTGKDVTGVGVVFFCLCLCDVDVDVDDNVADDVDHAAVADATSHGACSAW